MPECFAHLLRYRATGMQGQYRYGQPARGGLHTLQFLLEYGLKACAQFFVRSICLQLTFVTGKPQAAGGRQVLVERVLDESRQYVIVFR